MIYFKVSVRVWGDTLDPNRFTQAIGIDPTSSFSPGDPISKRGRGAGMCRKYGSWRKLVESDDEVEFCRALQDLLAELPANFSEVVKSFAAEADVFLGVFDIRNQSTFFLDEDVIQLLAEKQLSVCFDLYVEDDAAE